MSKFVRVGMSANDWRKLAKMIDDATEYADNGGPHSMLNASSLQNSMECEAVRLEREADAVEAAEE